MDIYLNFPLHAHEYLGVNAASRWRARMGERRYFPDISSRAWEHPADSAALHALQRIPGFDHLLRKVMGLIAERTLHAIHSGGAVEVGPEQYPEINEIYEEVLKTLDAPTRYKLYLSQNPVVNAGAVGSDNPFIVLNSGIVSTLEPNELRYVLGHEVGHILSDHVLYKTMLRLSLALSRLALSNIFSGVAYMAVMVGLLEWDRKSELSADRAGLLAVQDVDTVRWALLHLAGGKVEGASIEAFQAQARRFAEGGDSFDSIARTLALLGRSHPFAVQRLREIDVWIESGGYEDCLAGNYAKRSDPKSESKGGLAYMKESVNAYAHTFNDSADPLTSKLRGLGKNIKARASGLFTTAPEDEEDF